eukprot:492469_1
MHSKKLNISDLINRNNKWIIGNVKSNDMIAFLKSHGWKILSFAEILTSEEYLKKISITLLLYIIYIKENINQSSNGIQLQHLTSCANRQADSIDKLYVLLSLCNTQLRNEFAEKVGETTDLRDNRDLNLLLHYMNIGNVAVDDINSKKKKNFPKRMEEIKKKILDTKQYEMKKTSDNHSNLKSEEMKNNDDWNQNIDQYLKDFHISLENDYGKKK